VRPASTKHTCLSFWKTKFACEIKLFRVAMIEAGTTSPWASTGIPEGWQPLSPSTHPTTNWEVWPASTRKTFLSFQIYSVALVFRLTINNAGTNPPSAISGIPDGRQPGGFPPASSERLGNIVCHCTGPFMQDSRRCLARHRTTNVRRTHESHPRIVQV
jgi:hypothetical protein